MCVEDRVVYQGDGPVLRVKGEATMDGLPVYEGSAPFESV
jgi:hypothetical protein